MSLQVNQRQLSYTTLGNGRPLLLLPDGIEQRQTSLRPWLDGLSQYAQLIIYDPCAQDNVVQLAEVDSLRDHLGYERLSLFGFGKGSLLALAYALCYPERVMGMILCSLVVEDGETAPYWHQIETPTLILAGRHDTVCPHEQTAEPMHAILPNSQLVVFDKSGHCPFVDETERFTAVVGEWLSQSDKS